MIKEKEIKRLDLKETVDDISTRLSDSLAGEVVLDDGKNQAKEIKKLFASGVIMYLNPTEIAPITDIVGPGEDFLTVLGSGDFLIESAFHGANRVLSFDINKNQYYVAQMKLKALQRIDYKDYEDFFAEPYKDTYLLDEIYNKIKEDSLDNNRLYAFWDLLLDGVKKDREITKKELLSLGLPINRDELLRKLADYGYYYREGLSERTLNYILYELDEDYDCISVFNHIMGLKGYKDIDSYRRSEVTYNKARNKVRNSEFTFIESDLALVKNKLDEIGYTSSSDYNRFNSIYLSNIPEYLEGEDFYKIFENTLIPLLKEDGVVSYCCQGMNPNRLCMSEDRLIFYKNVLSQAELDMEDLLTIRRVINNVEAFKRLRDKYKLELVVDSSLDSHGFDLEDTFVFVKKK